MIYLPDFLGATVEVSGVTLARRKVSGVSSIAVPGHLALTKFIKTSSVAKEKRGKIIAFEAAENIPYPLNEVVWDYLVVADDSFDIDVMLTAVKFDAMQASIRPRTFSAGRPYEVAEIRVVDDWRSAQGCRQLDAELGDHALKIS